MKTQHADEKVVKAHVDAKQAHDKAASKLRDNAKAAVADAVKKNTSINPPTTVKPVPKVIIISAPKATIQAPKVTQPAPVACIHPAAE